MDKLKELYEEAWEELEGAEKYAKQAAMYKDKHPTLSKMFHDMSGQEMMHSEAIMAEAEKLAGGMEHGKPMHDIFKQMHANWASKIKALHAQYR